MDDKKILTAIKQVHLLAVAPFVLVGIKMTGHRIPWVLTGLSANQRQGQAGIIYPGIIMSLKLEISKKYVTVYRI